MAGIDLEGKLSYSFKEVALKLHVGGVFGC